MPTCRQNNMPHYNISKHHPQLIKQSTMDLSLDNHIQKLKLKWPECPSQPIFSVNLPAQKYWMPDDKSWVRRTALALRLVMTQASCYLRCPRETKKKISESSNFRGLNYTLIGSHIFFYGDWNELKSGYIGKGFPSTQKRDNGCQPNPFIHSGSSGFFPWMISHGYFVVSFNFYNISVWVFPKLMFHSLAPL